MTQEEMEALKKWLNICGKMKLEIMLKLEIHITTFLQLEKLHTFIRKKHYH